MGKYQDWCIESLENIASEEKFIKDSSEYKKPIISFITHYPLIYYYENEKAKNLWQKKITNSPYLMSKAAKEIYDNAKLPIKKDSEFLKKLHWEHITPNSIVFDEIMEAKTSGKAIKDCFKQCKIIILTKKEAKFLDGKGQKISDDDLGALRIWYDKSNNADIKEFINYEIDRNKPFINKHCKSNGTALARIAHLYNSSIGVKEYYLNNNKFDIEDKNDLAKIINYLNPDVLSLNKEDEK